MSEGLGLRSSGFVERQGLYSDEQVEVAFNAFHCIPVRSTNKIASIASRSGTRGR